MTTGGAGRCLRAARVNSIVGPVGSKLHPDRLQLSQRIQRRANDLGFLAMSLEANDQLAGLAQCVAERCLQLFRRLDQIFRRTGRLRLVVVLCSCVLWFRHGCLLLNLSGVGSRIRVIECGTDPHRVVRWFDGFARREHGP